MPNCMLTNSKACAAVVLLLSSAASALGCIFLCCSHLEHKLRLDALHLHGARPCDNTRPQATRQGGLRTWGHALVPANLGNREACCRSTGNLSTAAEMGGAARREGEGYAPASAGSLPAAPALAQRNNAAPCTHVHAAAKLNWLPLCAVTTESSFSQPVTLFY